VNRDDKYTLKTITLEFDYVEFEDGSILGPNKVGAKRINGQREGAEKYKKWIAEQYRKRGSVDAILPLLSEDRLPGEMDFTDSQKTGGMLYRKHLLMAAKTHGEIYVERYLRSK
jgi:hypothetical protein